MPIPANLRSRAFAAGGNGSANARYPKAQRLTITADCGGSNGARVRLWKRELQRFADETGLVVTVAHLPPGTSKWNRIEHRLFCLHLPELARQTAGQPPSHDLTDRRPLPPIPASPSPCDIDQSLYPKGIKVTDAEMATLNIQRHTFQGDWN